MDNRDWRQIDNEIDAIDAALAEDYRALTDEAPIPSSAIVWWRAQMRARGQALEKAAEPISVAQGIAVACAGGLTATAAGYYVPTFRRAIDWLVARTGGLSDLPLPAVSLGDPAVRAVLVALAFCAVLTPVALYFTLRED